LLLINGSEGIATGFAQKILPRNPKNIIKYIEELISGKTPNSDLLKPWFNGFNGEILPWENKNQYIINGIIERKSLTKLLIKEIPVQYSLTSYTEVLDDLEDKKIIRGYKDLSENDNFLFEIEMDSKTIKESSDRQLLSSLKLSKLITENFTCVNENNRIEEYTSPEEIIKHFLRVKIGYIKKRKLHILSTMQSKIDMLKSKYVFIKLILDEKLTLNKKSKSQIISDIGSIPEIIKINDSYDYLVNMPLHSLSKETFEKISKDLEIAENEYKVYNNLSEISIYNSDIESVKQSLNKIMI